MSFPFGSGMPQPNQSQHPPSHHHQPNPYHQQPAYNNQPPAQPFGVGYPNVASYPATSGQYPTFGGAPYPPQGHNNAAPYPTTQHAHQYQQYPQAYPAGPIGGVPVYPTLPQHNHHQPQHQYQPPHQAPFGQTLTTTHGGSHQYNNNAPSGHHQTGYGAPPGGFNVAYGQQPAAYSAHQRPASVPAAQQQPKGMPIIRPADNFSAVDDAKALRKAMKGFGTDEDGLIAILCHRSNDQIQHIKSAYKTNFGRDLLEDVRSETSGNFRSVLCALLLPRLDYFAKELNDAMAGLGTDEDALVEILCSLSNYEIQAIRAHYKQVYYKDLESELISETSGHFKRLLVSMVTAGRDESGVVDLDAAQQDATALLRAGELRVGTDESTFNMVLCQRNYAQIRAICDEYQRLTGHSLLKAIDKEFSGDIRDGLMAVVQCMSNKAEFFATRLHKSMAGLGTTDSQLIRVLVMRAEVDLADVKAAFERLYGKSLRSWIKGDTSGHYKHALYHLIGETASSS